MDIGGGQEKKEWQARTTADERMDAIAAQERMRMLSRSMAISSIGISAVPGEDGGTINDEIAGPNKPTTNGGEHAEDKERLRKWRATELAALALL